MLAEPAARRQHGPSGGEPPRCGAIPLFCYLDRRLAVGGHGLATAHYLAKEHGISKVAVVEKGWLGGGNTGRNTTIIRSNYLFDESAALYEHIEWIEGRLQIA